MVGGGEEVVLAETAANLLSSDSCTLTPLLFVDN